METQGQVPVTPQKVSIPSDELLAALYYFWDAFERASMNFFLVKNTAKQVMEQKDLSGDCIELGIRKNEWQGGQTRIFKAFIEHNKTEVLPSPQKEGKDFILFNYKSVPVYLYIYEEHPTLSAFNIYFYKMETFNVPNPFDKFEKECDQ